MRRISHWIFEVVFWSITIGLSAVVGFFASLVSENLLLILIATATILCLLTVCAFYFRRWLADNAWFFVRIPEMRLVALMKDRNLLQFYIACSDKDKTEALKKVLDRSKCEVDFVPNGKLIWLGFPWSGYEIYGWYENSRDIDDPGIDPTYTLYLGEQTWDYATRPDATDEENKKFLDEWSVDTADPIQVTPKLTASIETINPQKALFGVEHYEEAIQKEIFGAWKRSVQGLKYFSIEEVDGDEKNILQKRAQDVLNIHLGLQNDGGYITEPENFAVGTPAYIIYHTFGIWLKRVRILDIDPADKTIRNNLEAKIRAQTAAAAAVETAKGERDAKIITADGEVYQIDKVGSAEATIIKKKLSAKGSGYKDIAEKLELSKSEKTMLFLAEMAIQMTENANYTYLTGEPGHVGSWLLAAADQLKGGVAKIKAGDAEGINDLKKTIEKLSKKKELSKDDRASLIKLLTGGEKDEQNGPEKEGATESKEK